MSAGGRARSCLCDFFAAGAALTAGVFFAAAVFFAGGAFLADFFFEPGAAFDFAAAAGFRGFAAGCFARAGVGRADRDEDAERRVPAAVVDLRLAGEAADLRAGRAALAAGERGLVAVERGLTRVARPVALAALAVRGFEDVGRRLGRAFRAAMAASSPLG